MNMLFGRRSSHDSHDNTHHGHGCEDLSAIAKTHQSVYQVRYVGYLTHGYTFRFTLEGFPDLLDDFVDSAGWDSLGNLVYSRAGALYKYSLDDLKAGYPSSVLDLEPLKRPDQNEI